MAPFRAASTLLLAALASTACAHHVASDDSAAPARDTPVPIEVENHNWSDMVIFLDRGNLSQRLGTVGGARLRADPIGALRNFSSETINLQPGQTIKWTIENDIDRSFLGIY